MLDVLQMNHTVQCTYAYLLCKYIVSLYLITYQQTRFIYFFLEAWDTSIVLQVRVMQPLLINQPGSEDVSPLSLPPWLALSSEV